MIENILFFPGMIAHEIAHAIACILTGTRIIAVKPWGLKEAYVRHEESGPFKMLVITLAPFLFNLAFAALFIYIGNIYFRNNSVSVAFLMYWISASLCYHSLPSHADVKNAYSSFTGKWFSWMFDKEGVFLAVLAWVLFIPVFIPVMLMIFISYIFSQVEHLGLLFFVVMFIWIGHAMGL